MIPPHGSAALFVNGASGPQVERLLQLELHLFPFLKSWASASNVSHTVVLRPLKAGYFNFTSATITYLAQEDGPVVVSWRRSGLLSFETSSRKLSKQPLNSGEDKKDQKQGPLSLGKKCGRALE